MGSLSLNFRPIEGVTQNFRNDAIDKKSSSVPREYFYINTTTTHFFIYSINILNPRRFSFDNNRRVDNKCMSVTEWSEWSEWSDKQVFGVSSSLARLLTLPAMATSGVLKG